jgi:mannose-6-phosphate isomerase-like protein (cupin superfamily)
VTKTRVEEGGPTPQHPSGVCIFSEPTLVRHSDATRVLWGDDESGHVTDLVYGRGERISAAIFILGVGHWFGASENWKPFYDQHRFYYVVQGSLAIHDPEAGDVAVAAAGEAITWQGARYHFGYNVGNEEVIVLDWFAPAERGPDVPEADLMAGKPRLGDFRGGRYELLKAWPDRREDEHARVLADGAPMTVRPEMALHFVHGSRRPLLVSVLSSSRHLTAGSFSLVAGSSSESTRHQGDEVVYALSGRLHVHLPERGEWFELGPLDCLYLPEGTRHEYRNYGSEATTAVFCMVPG